MLGKRIVMAAVAVTSAAVLAACGGSSSSSSSSSAAATAAGTTAASAAASGGSAAAGSAAGKKVGFMVFDIGLDPFVSVMVDAVEQEAKAQGMEITTVNGKNDLNTQVAAVQQFVTDGMDAILLYPGDPSGIVPAVQQAADKGIPVFTVNLSLKEGAPVVAYIGADDYVYGQDQGQMLVDALGDKGGNVGLLMGSLGTSAQIQRTAGIKDFLKDYPNIKLVEEQTDDWATDKSLALVQNWTTKYPKGELAAVVAQGPQIVPVADWAKKNGRDEITFIAGDYPTDVQKAIVDGLLYGTVNQDPKQQGQAAIDAVANWVSGNKDKVQQPAEFTPLPIITKDNAASTPAAY